MGVERSEKFNLPAVVLDARTWARLREAGIYDPLERRLHRASRTQRLFTIRWAVA